jgi:hypothetical protein
MELRDNERIPVDFPVLFADAESGIKNGTVYNLSLGGCAVSTMATVGPGTNLTLSIRTSNQSLPITVERAAVRWTALGEFGLEFIHLGIDGKERIRRILESTPRVGN